MINEENKWLQYVEEKKKLEDLVLTPEEYEIEIQKIVDKLNL